MKEFDSVKFMRNVRIELSERYRGMPDLEKNDLKKIRDKYGL